MPKGKKKMVSPKKASKPSSQAFKGIAAPSKPLIVAALKAEVKKDKWPIKINDYGLTRASYSQALVMEFRSVMATWLSWMQIKDFLANFYPVGQRGMEWTESNRLAMDLVYYALDLIEWRNDGTHMTFDEDWDGKYELSDEVLKRWEIKPFKAADNAAPPKDNRVKEKVEMPATKTGRTSAKKENKSNTPKSKAAKKKTSEEVSETLLTATDVGYLLSVYDTITDLHVAMERFKNPHVASARIGLEAARQALYQVLPEE